jgi:NitT/TauT family transport system substrate-binding protein
VFNSADWAPRVTQTVGVVQTEFLKKNPDLIRGIVQARRKGVEFIRSNPDEAATILAKEYKIAPAEAKAAIADINGTKGVYWSPGDFDYEGMQVMLRGLQLVKAIESGPFDWSKVVDESYLPEDLRRKPKS